MTHYEIQDLYQQVKEQLNQGNAQDAKDLLDKVPLDSSDNLFVEYLQGVCEQELGNIDRAKKRFQYVVSVDPSFVAAAEALVHMDPENISEGELKYLYQLIIAEKPRVSQQISSFMMRHHETVPVVPVDYSGLFKDSRNVSVDAEEHFSDAALNRKEQDTEDLGEGIDQAQLEERTRAATEDPDSLIDPVFGAGRPGTEQPAAVEEASSEETAEAAPVDMHAAEPGAEPAEAPVSELEADVSATAVEPAEAEMAAPEAAEAATLEMDEDESDTESYSEEEIHALMKKMGLTEGDEDSTEPAAADIVEAAQTEDLKTEEEIDIEAIEEQAAAAAMKEAQETGADSAVMEGASELFPESEAVVEAAEAVKIAPEEKAAAPEKPEAPEKPAIVSASKEARASSRKKKEATAESRVNVEENRITGERIVRVETYTMAEIYIKQGLYHEALQILEKLRERAEDSQKIEETIQRVHGLLSKDSD